MTTPPRAGLPGAESAAPVDAAGLAQRTDPRQPGPSLTILDGLTAAGRRDVLRAAARTLRAWGVEVFTGITPAPPLDDPRAAVYDALLRSGRWRASRRMLGSREPADSAGTVDDLRRAAGGRPFVLALEAVDPTRPSDLEFVRQLARQLGAVGESGSRGHVVVNPLLEPGPAAHRVTVAAAHTDLVDLAAAVTGRTLAGRLHPDAVARARAVSTDPQIWPQLLRGAASNGRLLLVDGVWVPGADLEPPALPLTHPSVSVLLGLSGPERQIVEALAVIGPATTDELGGIMSIPGAPLTDALGRLAERGVVTCRSRAVVGGEWSVASPVLAAAAAAATGPARASLWQARSAGGSGRPPAGAVPGRQAPPSVVHDEDGEAVLDGARWAVAMEDPAAATWAALAAVVLVHRAQPDRVREWLCWAEQAGGAGPLGDHARARYGVLMGGGPVDGGAVWWEPLPPLPPQLSSAAPVVDAMERLPLGVDAGVSTSTVRDLLEESRSRRAVLAWCRAAEAASRRRLPPGPPPRASDGEDDVRTALVSLLVAGCTTATCANVLRVSRRTIEKRITALYREWGCSSRAQLAGARRNGGRPRSAACDA